MDEPIADWTVKIDADTQSLQRALSDASRLGQGFARTLTGAFSDIAVRGRKLDDVVRSVALSLSRMALKAAFSPIEQAISGAFGQISTGVSMFAKGGVPGRSMPVPFAHGGVVSSPTGFAFGRNGLGIAGERGAEAILPLSRGPDGRLGVKAAGGSAPINITFNVTATDAESFRHSQSQIAAMLNQTVGRGNRNL